MKPCAHKIKTSYIGQPLCSYDNNSSYRPLANGARGEPPGIPQPASGMCREQRDAVCVRTARLPNIISMFPPVSCSLEGIPACNNSYSIGKWTKHTAQTSSLATSSSLSATNAFTTIPLEFPIFSLAAFERPLPNPPPRANLRERLFSAATLFACA